MQIFGGGARYLTEKDMANTSAGTNLVYGNIFLKNSDEVVGTTKHTTLQTSDDTDNWNYCRTPLNCSFKKGDTITISLLGVLTGKQVGDGQYKATIYSEDLSICYDSHENDVLIKSGSRGSKTIVVNADSDPADPPYVLIYTGKAGSTGGNMIEINDLKVERGSIATQWSPAPQEYAMKADLLKYLLNGQSQTYVDDSFDLNSADIGTYRSWGKKPKNAPNDAEAWCLYIVGYFVESEDSKYEIALDTDGNIYCRTLAGSPLKWNSWRKITTTDVK